MQSHISRFISSSSALSLKEGGEERKTQVRRGGVCIERKKGAEVRVSEEEEENGLAIWGLREVMKYRRGGELLHK